MPNKDELKEYSVYLNIIDTYNKVEELLHTWNTDAFINLGIIVDTPPTLNYIHFCLDTYTEIVLEHHTLPASAIN